MRPHVTPRVLGVALGVLLTAQVASVATAATTGSRLDLPQPTAPAAVDVSVGLTKAETGTPSKLAVHAGAGGVQEDLAVDLPGAVGAALPTCGPDDRPETGLQGDVPLADQLSGRAAEGYNCGLQVVGYEPLGGRASNANMAWAGHCAYVAGDGIAVIDVSDPAAPKQVATLQGPGSSDAFETIAAMQSGDRAVLVAGRYGFFFDVQLGPTAPVDIYDVSDCTHPKLMSVVQFPQSVHNLTLTADLSRIWSTLPLQAVDIRDLRHPKYLGNLEDQLRADGVQRLEYAHEATLTPDQTRLYVGGQVPTDEESLTVDITGWPARRARLVARYDGPGHSIRRATIGGRTYLVRSDESIVNPTASGCVPTIATPFGGPAQPFLTDITDEAHPVDVGRLTLEVNRPEHCAEQLLSGVNASSHYQDVDDPAHTTFAMVSMWNAGLRIFDLRNPAAPREVAYLNPGQFRSPLPNAGPTMFDSALNLLARNALDQAWAHSRYVPETGQIWMATRSGGFWVLELEPQVRAALGLPARPTHTPLAGSPRPLASRDLAPPTSLLPASLPAGLYCTIGAAGLAPTVATVLR